MTTTARPGRARRPKPRRSVARRIARGVGYSMLTVVALVGALIGYLHTDAGKARVRALVVARLEGRVNGSVEIETLDYALLGTVRLEGVHLRDEAGAEVIGLERLVLVPAWSDLLRRRSIGFDEVSLQGLKLTLIKDAEGGSNLKHLFKPSPEPDPTAEPRKPLATPIDVRTLRIERVGVTIRSPDGTEIVLSDFETSGSVHVLPAAKDYSVNLEPLGFALRVHKPAEGGAIELGLGAVRTGVALRLVGGTGSLALRPLEANVELQAGARPKQTFPLRWGGVNLAVAADELSASLDKLVLGAVTLASLQVRSDRGADGLEGSPSGALVGLRIAAAEVNTLLGRELLGADIELEASLDQVEGVPSLKLAIESGGGTLSLAAKVDPNAPSSHGNPSEGALPGGSVGADAAAGAAATGPTEVTHDVTLSLRTIDTERLLATAAGVAPVRVESLDLHATGRGRDLASLTTELELRGAGLRVRQVPIDSVQAKGRFAGGRLVLESLQIDAVKQRLRAKGTVGGPDKEVDLTVELDGDVGVALRELKAAGLPIRTALPPALVRLPADDLRVTVKGRIGGALEVTAKAERLAVFGGTASLDAHAALRAGDPARGEKKVAVDQFDTALELGGVRVSSLLALRGKSLPAGLDARARLRVEARGTPEDPDVRLRARVETLREDGGQQVEVGLDGRVVNGLARVDLNAHRTGEPEGSLLEVHGRLPVAVGGPRPGLAPGRPLSLEVHLPRRSLASLAELVPPVLLAGRTIPTGTISLDAKVDGTAARPRGTAHLELGAALLSAEPGAPQQRIVLDASLEPGGKTASAVEARANLGVRLDESAPELLIGRLVASLSRSPLLGAAKELDYEAHLELPPVELGTLPDVPKLARVRKLGGEATATIDLHGNRRDLAAVVALSAKRLRPNGAGPLDASLRAEVGAERSTLELGVDLGGTPLATLQGTVGLAGTGLLTRLREGLDPGLDLTLRVPRRPVASLAALRPKLASMPGHLAGSLHLSGRAKQPLVESAFTVTDVKMLDGSDGGAALALGLDEQQLHAEVGFGSSELSESPIGLSVRASRDELEGLLGGRPLRIEAKAVASKVDVRRITPVALLSGVELEPDAVLDWNMSAEVELERHEGKVRVARSTMDGALSLAGRVPLPGTRRVFDDIELLVRAEPSGLRLERLALHEADEDEPNRTLTASGHLGLERLRPTEAELSLQSRQWLLFGAGPLGRADAPRGTLTLDTRVRAALDRPIRSIEVDVRKLEVQIPDRFPKAHQPEEVHLGDVIRLGEEVALGKLPVPKSVLERAEAEQAASTEPAAPTPNTESAAEGEPGGLDLHVHVANGSRLFQSPIDLITGGDIHVRSRPGGRQVTGKLTMTGGELSLGGQMHALTEGSLVIDEEHPKGWIDLWFEKPLPPWALREVSEASAGRAIRIHMFGPPTDRTTVLSGAGSPGTLLDLLAMYNEGRPLHVSGPDMPQSVTVEFPQEQGLLILSFMAVNLPHLLFLDRAAAWSDPYDSVGSYGHVDHYEGEGYFADGQGRVRLARQPDAVGRSQAELEVDYLLVNDPRMLFGLGLTAGSRVGGGPGVVFEWSSED